MKKPSFIIGHSAVLEKHGLSYTWPVVQKIRNLALLNLKLFEKAEYSDVNSREP